jgi:glycosyltransferase involved in cell wall biosynthesis
LQEGDSEWDIWWRTFLIRPIYKNIYRRADHIQAISNFLAERAKKLGAKCLADVVGNGIEITNSKFKISNKSQTQNSKKIITVSRLVKKNGIKYLIESFQSLVTRYSLPIALIIVGDGSLRPDLERLAKNLKIDKQTEFVGNISNQEVYKYLAQADVFVRPSLSEGLGNAFLEAMAVGVPVIATPVGGIPDFLEDGKTGWFCQVKDPASIAEKINYILDEKNKDEVARVVENAKKMVEEKYNWNNIASSMRRIFNQLISKQ